MDIVSVASAFPEHRYPQRAITDKVQELWVGSYDSPDLVERFHSRTGVEYRHFAMPLSRYEQMSGWSDANRAWIEVGQELGERALDAALHRAGMSRRDLDAIYLVSITGISSPSLDAKLINRMGLRSDIKRTPIFGLGCVGGATVLTRAADYVRAYPEQRVAVLAVELCSLTVQLKDYSTANVIATGLFADGAAAAIVAGRRGPLAGPTIVATRSIFYPGTEEIMGWDISEKGFSLALSPKLPELISSHLAGDVEGFLRDQGLGREQVENWVIHPGGPKIVTTIAQALGLSGHDTEASLECLRRAGNLSGASVLLVLEEVVMNRHPAPGSYGLLLAMGPGFSSELILLRW
jgi:alkylresorcinol/alkylpyrone synthase